MLAVLSRLIASKTSKQTAKLVQDHPTKHQDARIVEQSEAATEVSSFTSCHPDCLCDSTAW